MIFQERELFDHCVLWRFINKRETAPLLTRMTNYSLEWRIRRISAFVEHSCMILSTRDALCDHSRWVIDPLGSKLVPILPLIVYSRYLMGHVETRLVNLNVDTLILRSLVSLWTKSMPLDPSVYLTCNLLVIFALRFD